MAGSSSSTRVGRPRTRALAAVRLAAAVLLALSTTVAVGGCSSGPGGESPEAAVEAFYRALGAKDTAAACSVIAYSGKPLAGDDILLCRTGFDTVVEDVASPDELAAFASATVTGSTITGDTAVVHADQLTGVPAAYRDDVSLVRVAGRWYIESPR